MAFAHRLHVRKSAFTAAGMSAEAVCRGHPGSCRVRGLMEDTNSAKPKVGQAWCCCSRTAGGLLRLSLGKVQAVPCHLSVGRCTAGCGAAAVPPRRFIHMTERSRTVGASAHHDEGARAHPTGCTVGEKTAPHHDAIRARRQGTHTGRGKRGRRTT